MGCDFICCRYCGHFFKESDIPDKCWIKVPNQETKEYDLVESDFEYQRCPSCMHVLNYDMEKNLPESVVWRNDKKYIRKI